MRIRDGGSENRCRHRLRVVGGWDSQLVPAGEASASATGLYPPRALK
jgi:hypothetical protein